MDEPQINMQLDPILGITEYRIVFPEDRQRTYPVSSELLEWWIDRMNELEQLRFAVRATPTGFPL